ncbi:tyrosine-type recombinase/integrase [Antarcticirhabdus aurantiaca]|uniref:Tyrosine-type recombinase/integrase n=1 Tax=Antarcticirhabdus aurantiaca TaxID=2606717 RepID=A0ACD4NIX2_9HYPH|nr:tyrosine-type recombinase/integrase [Antarcticirhabdus aurantiaca]WAJ26671.1 tyrosine-type recombinase/integrase [Jeongeuplla avenae]
MGYYIATAGPLARDGVECSVQEWTRISACALPKGFRYLVSNAEEIVEPVLLFLYRRCIQSSKVKSVGNSQKAFSDDLYELFSYLEVVDLRWDAVDIHDLIQYRETLQTSLSPKTGKKYRRSTIARRMRTIQRFYKWAHRNGYCDDIGKADDDDLVHRIGDASRDAGSGDDLIPKDDGSDSVDAIGADDLTKILRLLGPLPKDRGAGETSVYRLGATVAVGTGMRIDEVMQLTLLDIQNVQPASSQAAVSLVITKTKGGRARRVFIPNPIYEDLLAYINGERKECVADPSPTYPLFVNRADAHRNPGRPMTTHTMWRNFHAAVIKAGLSYQEPVVRDDKLKLETRARHSFHDLRHTYAVVMYQQLVKRGKSAPWLVLARLLGHKYVETTVRIYLRSVDTIEAELTDFVNQYIRVLRDA